MALAQAPLHAAAHMGYGRPSEASLLRLSSPSQPSQGMVRVRLSLVIRHGPTTAPGTLAWPCVPIAATLDTDMAPLFCFSCGSAFSGCCLSETSSAKWLIHRLLPFGLQRKCGSFLCNMYLPGQHQPGAVLQSPHCLCFPPEKHSITFTKR